MGWISSFNPFWNLEFIINLAFVRRKKIYNSVRISDARCPNIWLARFRYLHFWRSIAQRLCFIFNWHCSIGQLNGLYTNWSICHLNIFQEKTYIHNQRQKKLILSENPINTSSLNYNLTLHVWDNMSRVLKTTSNWRSVSEAFSAIEFYNDIPGITDPWIPQYDIPYFMKSIFDWKDRRI